MDMRKLGVGEEALHTDEHTNSLSGAKQLWKHAYKHHYMD